MLVPTKIALEHFGRSKRQTKDWAQALASYWADAAYPRNPIVADRTEQEVLRELGYA